MSPDSSFNTFQLHNYLDRMRAGDVAAADELLRTVGTRLERLAHQMLRGFPNVKRWAETDDVVQCAVVRLLHTLRALRPETTRDFINLAATHIRRELLDLARHFRNRCAPAGGSEPELPDGNGTAESDLEMWAAFHEQVESLPSEEREVVALTFYHGWTQPQIAELFKVDERTVRRRWRSACARLSERLGGRLPSV